MQVEGAANVQPNSVSRVLVLYTGGTIGMVKDQNGDLVPKQNYLVPWLRSHPLFHDKDVAKQIMTPEELKRFLVLPKLSTQDSSRTPAGQTNYVMYEVVEYNPLLDSSNIKQEDWIKMASDVKSSYDDFDGFVVLHGTDTMAYTASGLSFICEHLSKPVIITGSQIPIYEVRSDGIYNLINSLVIAGVYNIPEVMLCFNEKVFRGNRCIKYDASDFGAFTSPNFPPLVSLGINIQVDWSSVFHGGDEGRFDVQTTLCPNVGILWLFPGITSKTVKGFLKAPMQGVVLRTFGEGDAPSNNEDMMKEIKKASQRGVLIINVTQCVRGYVKAAYATGEALDKAGVIPGGDLTPEAALAKLSYVLGKAYWTPDFRKKMLRTNIRGEMRHTIVDPEPTVDSGKVQKVK